MTTCANCDADLHLDRSDTGPGGWLGTHDPKTTHPMDQNTLCCPGTQNEHEPKMETCPDCVGMGLVWDDCEECGGEIDTERDSTEEYACDWCQDSGESQVDCELCDGSGEVIEE